MGRTPHTQNPAPGEVLAGEGAKLSNYSRHLPLRFNRPAVLKLLWSCLSSTFWLRFQSERNAY